MRAEAPLRKAIITDVSVEWNCPWCGAQQRDSTTMICDGDVDVWRAHNAERYALCDECEQQSIELTAARARIAKLEAGIKDAMGYWQAEDWHGKLQRALEP